MLSVTQKMSYERNGSEIIFALGSILQSPAIQAQMAIITHSGQSVFFIFLILGIVLGLA